MMNPKTSVARIEAFAPKPASASVTTAAGVAGAGTFGSPVAPKQPSLQTWRVHVATILKHRIARSMMLTLYYLAILAGLVWLYGKGDFSTPTFIYQGF